MAKPDRAGAGATRLAFLLASAAALAQAGAQSPAPPQDAAASAAPDAHLDYPPGQAPKFWSVAAAETVMARWPDFSKAYFNAWTYVNGYELYGFDMLYRATGDKKYFDYTKRYIDQFMDDRRRFSRRRQRQRPDQFTPVFNNLDNMMTGNTLVMLYEYTRDAALQKGRRKNPPRPRRLSAQPRRRLLAQPRHERPDVD